MVDHVVHFIGLSLERAEVLTGNGLAAFASHLSGLDGEVDGLILVSEIVDANLVGSLHLRVKVS